MTNKHLSYIWLCVSVSLIALSLGACGGGRDDHPAAALQGAIAAQLEDPSACPSGDSGDVQQLVDAAGLGGLVRLPEGCYLITTTINIPPGGQLIGAGMDKTILYREPGRSYAQPMLRVQGRMDAPGGTHITGLALVGVRQADDTGEDYGLVLASLSDFRVDHCYFEGIGFAGLRVESTSRGVVDHSIVLDNFKPAIDNLGYGVAVYGAGLWEAEIHPGGTQATFVEDSIFIGNRHAIAANAGAHYVFRSNQVLQGVVACAVDAHGMGYGSAHGMRGEAGVIFENTIDDYDNPILLILEWGTPDNLKAEYPAFEQVQELYVWDNQVTGGPSEPQVDENGVGFIELGRDYFTEPLPGYMPYEYPHPLTGEGVFDAQPWPPD